MSACIACNQVIKHHVCAFLMFTCIYNIYAIITLVCQIMFD